MAAVEAHHSAGMARDEAGGSGSGAGVGEPYEAGGLLQPSDTAGLRHAGQALLLRQLAGPRERRAELMHRLVWCLPRGWLRDRSRHSAGCGCGVPAGAHAASLCERDLVLLYRTHPQDLGRLRARALLHARGGLCAHLPRLDQQPKQRDEQTNQAGALARPCMPGVHCERRHSRGVEGGLGGQGFGSLEEERMRTTSAQK
mmetsp:Transcript_70195/g.182079  ORF Transcript_70195/g.182079 Transcript_70195/m.182079 type:complete len:200 (+) Transcript_70195:580-1179(+)